MVIGVVNGDKGKIYHGWSVTPKGTIVDPEFNREFTPEAYKELTGAVEVMRLTKTEALVHAVKAGEFPDPGNLGLRSLDDLNARLDEAASVVPKLRRDNPGARDPEFYGPGGWLGSKIRKAAEKRASATPYTTNATLGGMDGVTGYFRERLKIRPETLRDIKGAMGEERFAGGEKLQRLEASIAKEGYLDDSPILIAVREDGVPFIVEGNNRVQEAIKSGRPHINVEIQYLRGAEDVEGPLSPGNLPSVMARAQETKLPK